MSALLAPSVLLGGLAALGSNGNLSGSVFALASFLTGIAVLLLLPPREGFWFEIRWSLFLFGGALAWAALPLLTSLVLPPGRALGTPLSPGSMAPRLLVQAAGLGWFVMGAVMASRTGVSRRAVRILIVLGLLWLAVPLILRASGTSYPILLGAEPSQDRFAVTLLNANTAGCTLGMLAILACGEYLALAHRLADPLKSSGRLGAAKIAFILVVMSFCLGGIALTGSRLALLLTGLGVLFLLLTRGRLLWRQGPEVAIPTIGALVVPPTALVALAGERIVGKFSGFAGDFNLRMRDMIDFASISLREPWFGFGLGSFRHLNLATLAGDAPTRRWNFGAAHNSVLQAALEGGWPYALLGVAGAMFVAGYIFVSRRYIEYDIRMLALIAAVMVGVGAGLIDIALDVPAVLALVAWLAGMAYGRAIRALATTAV